jgi:hypothetical protein
VQVVVGLLNRTVEVYDRYLFNLNLPPYNIIIGLINAFTITENTG